ncbi:YlbF family regulator [[Clostridium] colinum]|uniref:YlbF family regulator n=1 Tax=[Clostridium] colinum TaxID=36835 RepID=UPI0020256FD0|nr:YlbF family regulator [[Clostridium] colinum]
MNNLFEQARELAKNLLETNQGKKYQEAKYIFEGDDEAVGMLQEYGNKTRDFQMKMQRGESGEEFENAKQELNNLVAEMKKNSIITELFKAEGEFNQMVASVMDIFNATLTGESEEQGGCCSGGCGGCTGCH